MSYESALIAQSRRPLLAARAREALEEEISKGCMPGLADEALPLEPPFHLLSGSENPFLRISAGHEVFPKLDDDWVRTVVWIAPEHPFDWRRSELFVKQLQGLSERCALEFCGNSTGVTLTIFFHRRDTPVVVTAFHGQFELCGLSTPAKRALLPEGDYGDIVLRDFYPLPPYSRLLTRPDELRFSPYESMLLALSNIPPPARGIYQVVFQPTHPDHAWHANIELIQDIEYALRQWSSPQGSQRFAQQAPSGDLRNMAWELETKAHRDKPIYAVALRSAVVGGRAGGDALLRSLVSFASVFQHGGQPLRYLTEQDYHRQHSQPLRAALFEDCLTFRHGFLVNSEELSGLAHIPAGAMMLSRKFPVDIIVRPELKPGVGVDGIRLGACPYADESVPVRIPDRFRSRHVHMIGVPAMGKSSEMENLILQDIDRGAGVAVLDPHGDLVERLLCLIPAPHVDRTIYFDPGDPEWVPLWNLLTPVEGQDIGRAADDLVAAFKSIVTGWGDRLEHLLRHAFFGLLRRPRSTLLDAALLMRTKSPKERHARDTVRDEILEHVTNPLARQFWLTDFDKYRKEDLAPVQHKLSKLLVSDTVSRMLSQPDSKISLKDIMETRKVFLANLSTVGSETREVLGKLLLSFFHLNALTRNTIPPDERVPFYIYCDEAHRFLTDAIEDLLAETRKYGIGLTLAHQYLSQFDRKKVDALSSAGTALIFRVDARDAGTLTKDLFGKVSASDLIALEPRNVIARMGGEVFQFQTDPVRVIPVVHNRDLIINESHRKYYSSADAIAKASTRNRGAFQASPSTTEAEFIYDEF